MKAIHFIYIIIIALFLSCGGKGESKEKVTPSAEIASPEQMKAVLIDVMLAEGAVGISESKHHNAQYVTLHYYTYIFKKHNMTSQQFLASFNYYAGDVDQMEKIMTEVINDLSEKQGISRINNSEEEEE